ncbi:MAG: YhdH/YhfP family quinone oxidoreductase [Gallionellaceae bacterium]|jgi:acrylyl-CoA reductase (NADPH)
MKFRAYRIFNEDNKVVSRWVDLTLDELDAGTVVIRTAYSSVNYKDALAATGAGKVIRRFPCVGGIDVAGVVESSQDPRFNVGDEVLVTGYDMGVAHDGGYAELVRVQADWVVPLPQGLSLQQAMALGTAGFTAALSLYRLQQNDVKPANGKVVVTGASGGVGSLAIAMLAQLGYHVVAITGKDGEHDYLKSLGAAEVLPRSAIDSNSTRALEKSLWAAALDAVGGSTLAWLTRTMQQNGAIASFGNAGGVELNTTVLPFILRGVRLIGIDSAATAMDLRQKIWHKLANEWRPTQLDKIAQTLDFEQLPEVFDNMLSGHTQGRIVIKISS